MAELNIEADAAKRASRFTFGINLSREIRVAPASVVSETARQTIVMSVPATLFTQALLFAVLQL